MDLIEYLKVSDAAVTSRCRRWAELVRRSFGFDVLTCDRRASSRKDVVANTAAAKTITVWSEFQFTCY